MRARVPPACVAVPLLLGLLSVALQAPAGPVLFADEIAYLGIGVHLSARDAVVQLAELEFYSPGYGLVLAPLLSVVPFEPWAVAVAVNLVCLATIGPLLFLLLSEVADLDRRRAAAAATVAACTPAVLVQVTRAWPELLLTAVLALWALLAARFVGRRPAGPYGLAAAATAAVAMTIHRRAIVVVVVTAALLAHQHLSATRRRPARRSALAWLGASLGLLGAHHLLNAALDRSIKDQLYGGADLVDATERAVELAGGELVPQLLGHGWAVTQATAGLALLGTVAAVALLWRGPHRSFGVALAVAVGGAVAVSAVAVADGPRVDHLLYERYVAPLAVVAVAVALGALVDERRRISAAWLLVLPASTAALVLAVPAGRFEGNVQKLTAPTLATLEHLHRWTTATFLEAVSPVRTSAVVAAAAVVALAARRRSGLVAVGFVGAAFAGLVALGSVVALRPFLDRWEGYAAPLAEAIEAGSDDGGPIGVTPGAPEPVRAAVQYRTGHRRVVAVDAGSCPGVAHVIAEAGFEPAWPAEEVPVSGEPSVRLLRPRC